MSTDTEHAKRIGLSLLKSWKESYHIPVIGAIAVFMFWVRAQSYDRFITEDGTPALAAVDSWYHWRTVQWTAEHYPRTMPYEIWTSFPTGQYVGQFGTLFDQIIVTAAMIVGLGNPSTETLYTVSLLAVPVIASLVAVPVFYIGRRLGGTLGGIISMLILALSSGQFLQRSMAGQLQHHAAEVLFMAIAVLAMMVAIRVAEQEKPVYELVLDQDWVPLRKPTIYSVLAGVALSLYIWVWPPGVVLIGIFGVFFIVALCVDYVRGTSPDHLAFVGATSLGTTTLITTLLIEEPGFGTTSFNYLQPALSLLGVVGFIFLAWLAREWNDRGIERSYYPAAVAGLLLGSLAITAIVLPDLYGTLINNLTSRLLPLNPGTGTLTISEAQPPDNYPAYAFNEFGAAFYTMLIGLAVLALRPFLGREYRAEHTLVIIWSLFLISMSMTQIRFAYYTIIAVAVVNAVFVAEAVKLFDLDLTAGTQAVRQLETYQVITALLVVLLLFVPLLPPVAANPVWEYSDATAPNNEALTWEESTHWLKDNSPEPGNWAGAGNEDELDYYGNYDYPEDGDFDYPVGSYGVLSWWDYGHLITVQGERIPHSNPFQSNAKSSSAFLTAQSEERAELILDAVAQGEQPVDHTNEELEAMAGDRDSDEEIRYVMIDDATAMEKFTAITQWTGPDPGSYIGSSQVSINGQQQTLPVAGPQYHNTMTASLYLEDANGLEGYRLVHETSSRSVVGGTAAVNPRSGQVATRPLGSFSIGSGSWTEDYAGFDRQFRASPNEATLLGEGRYVWDARVVSSVKTFERVDGATITGTVDNASSIENGTVQAAVELETGTDRPFTYTQEATVADDGSFELTVPYATDDELQPADGYTNSSVDATSQYQVIVESDGEPVLAGETAVSERAVVEGDTVSVALEDSQTSDIITDTPDDGDETESESSEGNETESETSEETESDANAESDSNSATVGSVSNPTIELRS